MNRFEHGGAVHSPQIMLDFSANINPLGMPLSVKNALVDGVERFSLYPDTDCTELRKNLSAHEKIKAENIVCGNGAADLIYRIVYAAKPKKALLISPTFSEYEKALSEMSCDIDFYALDEKNDYAPDENLLERLTDDKDIFFLCNPNNPVGNVIDAVLMRQIADKCAEKSILLVVDECFMDFVADGEKYTAKRFMRENTVIIKAFTKTYAMAGLRLGYALFGSEAVAEKVKHTGQCWGVSGPAQLAGIAALGETEYVGKSVELVSREREYMLSAINKIGIKTYPSVTNFILFTSDIPLEKLLAEQGIAIRGCDNYRGLGKNFYRTAVRLHSENEALIKALERIVQNG